MRQEILTPRLRIRPWAMDDLSALAQIFAKPEVWRFPFGRGLSPEETEAYLQGKILGQESGTSSPSAVEHRATGRILGYIALSPPTWLPEVMPAIEIGWRIDPTFWNQGLATEGARAVLDYGFSDMALPEILSIYEPANVASGRVMEKIGMELHSDTTHPYFNRPLRIYRLSRPQWQRSVAERQSTSNEGRTAG